MENQISKLKNHYIICGFGRIGSLISMELCKSGYDFVVIEKDEKHIDDFVENRMLYIISDASHDETLERAGIKNAKGIITAVRSDADNVFIVLTARSLNPNIYILARASEITSESKLKKAGATKVMLPYLIGGHRMAQALIRPTVVDFIDVAMLDTEFGLEMGEATITEHSTVAGKDLIESNLRKNFGIIIVAIKKRDGRMVFNPTSDTVLEKTDVLVVLGKKKDLEGLRKVI